MKVIWFWEYDPEDIHRMFEKDDKIVEERGKKHGKYPKRIFPPHWLGMENKGFTIYEVDDPQQLVNLAVAFFPEKKSKFVPIFDKKTVKDTHRKMNK